MGELTSRRTRLENSAPGAEADEEDGDVPVTAIGRFSVLRKLGEGGMGVVYAAHDEELDRDVAIKLLRADAAESNPARARLLREARAMAKLSHPNVITIYDVGTVDEQVFIAMELVRGKTLSRWLAVRPRTWRGVVERFAEAGRGLAAAHRANLIHRDFKPDNVLVGEDGRVRVLDFGLARRVDIDDDDSLPPGATLAAAMDSGERLTITGALMGTPAYMAPEQWRGANVDHRTDQFAFTVALWEGLFGERPFGGGTAHKIASQVLGGAVSPPPDDRPIPAWLLRVLRRGLQTEPDDRFSSMDELLRVLTRLGTDEKEPRALPHLAAPDATLFARRYEVQDDPTASPTVLGKDRLTGRAVSIRWLRTPQTPHPETQVRRLVGLRHPNLAAVLDFGQRDGDPWVVVEHFEGAASFVRWGRDQPESIRMNLLAQLLRVVGYLHSHALVHNALSPQTVRVVDGQLKLTDPTPCILGPQDLDVAASYAAPEVLLAEGSDASSDLYSVGVIAHELFTGRRPAAGETTGELVDAALSSSPDVDRTELDPRVTRVLLRLLQPNRAQRFHSADEALAALIKASGLPLAHETVETRESALRTARFAGREAELARLVQALRRCEDGNGEVWLLGGESGIGKSRLLDELEAEAMARGAVVMRGQAKAEAAQPYEVWRQPFRLLALGAEEDLAAPVLAALVPDIDALRGHAVRRASELDAKNTQVRLHNAVLQSLRVFERPVVVLLEDLHWSRAESIELLQRLLTTLAGLPVLIVGSYREDEVPELPGRLKGARTLGLSRLDAVAVAKLAESMTGSRDPHLVALLDRETEGNPFFLVEVVRFLAEEAGTLQDVGGMTLPESVLSGGVRRVLRRRLDQVAAWARPLLETAAVTGRTVDVAVMKHVADEAEVDRAVAHCVDCAVLEPRGDGWRFRHDKLREHVLAGLDDERRAALHQQVADALEELHEAEAAPTQALAHHAREAGDLAREARYAGRAGELALRTGAYEDAVVLLSRAIELREHGTPTRHDLMLWYRMLGEAHYVLGDLSQAVEMLGGTLTELGRPQPESKIGWAFFVLRLVMLQALLLALPGRFAAGKAKRREELREGANAAGRIANLSTYSGDQLRIIANSLLSANLAERAGDANAYSLAVMGYASSYMGLTGLAEKYFARAIKAAREHDDPISFTEVSQMECAYRLGNAELSQVKRILDDGYAASERAGYQLGMALSEGFVGQCEYLLGNFEAMLAHYSRARELLTLRSPEHLHSFICGEALALCMLGRLDEASRLLTDGVDRVGAQYLLGEAFVLASRAFVHAFADHRTEALEAAHATNDYVRSKGIAVPGPCGYVLSGPAEAFLCAAEADPESTELREAAATQAATMLKWARKHPVGEATALLAQARVATMNGDAEAAVGACERGLASAKRFALRFAQARIEFHLAKLRGLDTEPGRSHIAAARVLFQRCGAAHHGRLLEDAVGS